MRTEIKAAIVVGLVVFVGAVIWAVNSGPKTDEIPFDVAPGAGGAETNIELAGDETVVPEEVTASTRDLVDGTRGGRPPVLSHDPLPAPVEATSPPSVADGPDEGPSGASRPAGPNGTPALASAPVAGRLAADRPGLTPAVRPGQPIPEADLIKGEPAPATETPTERDIAAHLNDLRRTPATPSTYTIQLGDTLSAIAREQYGEDRYWTAIQTANPDVDPRSLQPGQVIVLPSREQVVRGSDRPATRPATREGDSATYTVSRGDTLIDIARNALKDESRYMEIFELNRDKLDSPDLLVAGMELRLPPLEKKAPEEDEPEDSTD